MRSAPLVELLPVAAERLEELVTVATTRAAADEVTPPVTAGPEWSRERVAWLRRFHLERRDGLSGDGDEQTWAVVVEGRAQGSVRLRRTSEPGVLETGVWLARDARGTGVGTAAVAAVVDRARELGATAIRADTTAGNPGAVAVLRRLGFVVTTGVDSRVGARLDLAAVQDAPRAPRRLAPPPTG
ncbi:GNAT family N-acetyltransferase [Jatrophihabitans sp. YIM 134969]